jgi:hypothetical protein
MNADNSWRIVDRGVNGKPFLWKKRARKKYVLIDIFNARPKRCYAVLALDGNPLATHPAKGRVIGMGCADAPSDWVTAYEKARKIANRYMSKGSSRRTPLRK